MRLARGRILALPHQATSITNNLRDLDYWKQAPHDGLRAVKMLLRRLPAARPLARALRGTAPRVNVTQIRCASQAEIDDPNMNGGYINPPPEKRQFRDPYADWWDKQERRNYGEPVHEDNDILGMFSPEEYTHFKPGHGFFLLGCFIATTLGLCGVVRMFYADKPSAPREFPDGLERELGGPRALLARKPGE